MLNQTESISLEQESGTSKFLTRGASSGDHAGRNYLAATIAVYVIARLFGSAAVRIGESAISGTAVALDASMTIAEAESLVAAVVDSFSSGQLFISPELGHESASYRLTSNYSSQITVELSGPTVALGRISLDSLIDIIEWTLEQAWQNKQRTLDSLELVNPKQGVRLAGECAGRRVDYAQDKTISELFELVAKKTPTAEAITFGDLTLSYDELNVLVNGFAHHLAKLGVSKGEFVPILLKNSIELPIVLLALMQIGAPFVVVDTSWPHARIQKALDKLPAQRLICDHQFLDHHYGSIQNIVVDVEDIVPNRRSVMTLAVSTKISADDIMYGLFTSGSTGEPKCALNYHRGILNRFSNMDRRFDPSETGVVLQTSKHVYDGFLWQLFWPLTRGAKTIMPAHTSAPDPGLFVDLIERHQVSMTDIVPSIFKLLLRYVQRNSDSVHKLRSLRRILIGGEKINSNDIAAFLRLCPNVSFTNTYGPTEASIGMIMHDVEADQVASIPLGKPIDNTYAVIVDSQLRMLPKGTIGELLIGGDCLGAGYLLNSEATEKAFIDNPFSNLPSKQLYRTGDLACILPDETFQFAGRMDDQVSIGGARIEISEVEAAFMSLPWVEDVSVIPTESRAGTTQLIAFVLATTGSGTKQSIIDKITVGAKKILPRNYLPQKIVSVDNIPLMENGKTNRQLLLSMLNTESSLTAKLPEPSDDVEKKLMSVWCEILKLDGIAIDGDFFKLGGDSLQALMLLVELKHGFDVDLSLEDILANPKFFEQAKLLRGEAVAETESVDTEALYEQLLVDSTLVLSDAVRPSLIVKPPKMILLTGVTGFVGAHLAVSLLENSDADLICPVRGESEYSCIARVASTLASHSFWQEKYVDRIKVIPADLAQPYFGLGNTAFTELMSSVDAVILNAAYVHVLHNYESLKAVNVNSVRDVLNNSMYQTGVPVHYISSLSIFSDQLDDEVLVEDSVSTVPPARDGYAQTKWVADRLCLASSRAGAPVSVYRLGEMMSPLSTGLANEMALSTHLLSALLKLGVYPKKKVCLDYTPVDVAARITVRAIMNGITNRVYHICNDRPLGFGELSTMLASGLRNSNIPIAIPDQEFLDILRAACLKNPLDKDLRYVLELLPEQAPPDGILSAIFTQNSQRCETINAAELMKPSGTVWPELNAQNLAPTAHFFARRMQGIQPPVPLFLSI